MEFAYHRLARSVPGYRWWKPLVTGLIALAIFIGFTIVLVVLLLASTLVFPEVRPVITKLITTGEIDNSLPVVLAFSLSSIAVILPSVWLARLIMGPRPVGLLWSIAGRMRWRWMARLILPVVIAYGASTLFSVVLLPLVTGEGIPPATVSSSTWIVVLVAVVLVPLQATAEEVFFRGYLAQTIGGWLKHPLFAILLPVPLFTIGHQYDVWGLIDVSVFAVVAGWLAWRTGGLEASIVAHVVNNTVIFVIGAFGLVDVNSKTGSGLEVVISALTLALYAWLVLRAAKRFGLARVRVVTLPPPPDPATLVHSDGDPQGAVTPRG
ncbi:CPBP family intramembrane metalloprotease [Glaciihabitans sp. INWT7]|uniref:CPBP family intramembrane glutamic endopeptidase n=1 Tax=Glaciihabitans sp. INWT7 TaxID=2596912 RepID=UPI0016281330|nr:type II CAAX endopeptidase family protein [Glaciihabitans sp. INWT7]QNE48075.1 CPBP family intramembrane metalloprotease [Glaciihabitans sp. INWT7]